MPTLDSHKASTITKMLLIGDSGAGKTGALASLALAGYHLRIIDIDNGLDVLANLLAGIKSPKYVVPAFETITDPMRNVGGKLIPSKATVWQRVVKLLDNWETDTTKFGPISTWTDQDVLVIDSLSLLCTAAMNFVLMMNARLGQRPHQSDWGAAQDMVESLLQMLYDENVRCNVVINCHVTYQGEENGPQVGYPASLGKALSPKIGRYFNSCLMVKSSGVGANVKRQIHTSTVGMVELKNTAPTKVKLAYPIETGLADYFRDVRGNPPGQSPGTTETKVSP